MVAAMHKWAEVHTSAGFGVGIEWQMEGLTRDSVVLQLEQIQRLQSDLAQTTFESEMKVTGDLVLVDIDDRTFRLRGDGRAEYSGTFNEGIIGPEHRAVLPARYEATIKAITKAVPTDGEEEAPRHVLVALDPL